MNFSLIDTSKRIKLQHLNKSKLHLNKNGSRIDIYMISETKIDDSFPVGTFLINGFSNPFDLILMQVVAELCCM